MATYEITDSNQEQSIQKSESIWVSSFKRWKGMVEQLPLLNAIIEARADAITASYEIHSSKNAKVLAKILTEMRGNGKQTFKLIINNMEKIATTCGVAYAEIVRDKYEDIGGEIPVDLIVLPADDIRQVIENGVIKRYESATDSSKKYKPEDILQLDYNIFGCLTHGIGLIEGMENSVIHYNETLENGSKIFEKYIKPISLIFLNEDDPTQMQNIIDKYKATFNTGDAEMFLPKDVVDRVERVGVPPGSSLDPSVWIKMLRDEIIMGSRVPELALGTGSVNSEESAKMQFMGFRQSIRWRQEVLEETLKTQLFNQMFPDDTPAIRWSFASEPQEERFDRLTRSMQATTVLVNPRMQELMQNRLLIDMNLIEDVPEG